MITLTFDCSKCGVVNERQGCPEAGHDCPLLAAEIKRREEHLVYSAKMNGRGLDVVTYLEGGTRPVRATLICQSTEQSRELARVLTEAKGVKTGP